MNKLRLVGEIEEPEELRLAGEIEKLEELRPEARLRS